MVNGGRLHCTWSCLVNSRVFFTHDEYGTNATVVHTVFLYKDSNQFQEWGSALSSANRER